MIAAVFAIIGWFLFIACLSFFLGSRIIVVAHEERCRNAGLCPTCLQNMDYTMRWMSEMVDKDREEFKRRVEKETNEHKA